ncbi:isocitrate lyase/PEP mutase family protein [Pontixanthobacter aquaemixtae]|uniref:Isocitrate lyase/phosphoenolpyruvate mutase family protein n=1 Tax=Pontixanthobacter aquaemixtae TaxID=1958940 RepID=A0A844ZTF5_9SPHN|nr:isocitrate lyase/phosphoenolpyruvate mutase family protein [Pontixanthobacter aquaemixtae]MXO90744.1 isocitrate lyase/phosphoenolpyruvate mutase family protein [Pontixanthobacter aquaemixtae]
MTNTVEIFKNLHVPGDPLVLFNIWDAGSAKAVASAGAKALATGSYGVAEAMGFTDGETVPLDTVLANLKRIVAGTDLPVSLDIESGYGETAEQVGASVALVKEAGAAGINLEDRMPGLDELTAIDVQARRIEEAAKAGLFVNARCDVFRGVSAEDHGPALVEKVLDRAKAYADAGASGLFVPFTAHRASIAAICEASPIPVNIIWRAKADGGFDAPAELADFGVARISHGHQPWAAAMNRLADEARRVFAGGVPS